MTPFRGKVGKLNIKEIAHHRNGVCGENFDVVLFSCKEIANGVAIIFNEAKDFNPMVAVLDVDQTAEGNIAFACGNSWRGDHFSDDLREALSLWRVQNGLDPILPQPTTSE